MSNLKAVPNGFITPVAIQDQADKLTVKDIKKAAGKKKKAKPQAPKPAHNSKYDPLTVPQLIVEYLSKGYSVRSLITELKISRSTFQDWKEKYPEVNKAIEDGKAGTEKFYTDLGLDLAQGKVKGNVAAWCFLAKNVLGWKDNNEQKADPTPISISFGIAAKPAESTEKGNK